MNTVQTTRVGRIPQDEVTQYNIKDFVKQSMFQGLKDFFYQHEYSPWNEICMDDDIFDKLSYLYKKDKNEFFIEYQIEHFKKYGKDFLED